MIRTGSLVRFLKDTDRVDPAYWGLIGFVVDINDHASWLYGRETYHDVLVDDHVIRNCCEGVEIEEVTDEAG